MIVVDTSAWVEFLRGSDHIISSTLANLIEEGDEELAVTEVIVMEILAGARSGQHLVELRRNLAAYTVLRLEGLADFEEAALLYRTCREAGETIRALSDLLIAVPTIRAGASLLHRDSDFDALARHSGLMIHPTV